MRPPRQSLLYAAALAVSVGAACGGSASDRASRGSRTGAAAPAVTTVDDLGDTVRGVGRPARIVSLNPTTTEMLFALGAGNRVVGRSDYDVYPDSARRVPALGPALRPNVEAVLATQPALVLLYASNDNRDAARALRAAGVPVAAFRIDRADQFARTARTLGILVGDSARGARVADTVLATLARVHAATAGLPHPRAVWPFFGEPLYVAGAGSFLSELLDAAGARNVFADLPQPAPQVSREELARRAPDLVIAGPSGAARVRSDPAWRGLAAVRDGRVVVIDTALFLRPSVQLGAAAAALAEQLHPGALRGGGRATAPATAPAIPAAR